MARAFTSWTLDLPVLAATLLVAALYLAGVRRMRRTGEGWAPGRTAAFCGGLGVIVIATMSFLGVYQWVLFTPGRCRPSCCCWPRRSCWRWGGRSRW